MRYLAEVLEKTKQLDRRVVTLLLFHFKLDAKIKYIICLSSKSQHVN